MISIQSVTG